MEVARKPFQGVFNVLRFNWHFYLLAGMVITSWFVLASFFTAPWDTWLISLALVAFLTTLISLVVTYWVYDVSDLYQFPWLHAYSAQPPRVILNVNAGFDETSHLLKHHFPDSELHVSDFYDPERHTEISIKRARKAYPPYPGTLRIATAALPFPNQTFDIICLTFAAHEIRDAEERKQFFRELARVVQPGGVLFVTEHLRDWRNFLAYTIGFFHFYARHTWTQMFQSTGWTLSQEWKVTPFVSTLMLTADGNTP